MKEKFEVKVLKYQLKRRKGQYNRNKIKEKIRNWTQQEKLI